MNKFIVTLIVMYGFCINCKANADELTAGYLRNICDQDKRVCTSILIGLREGIKIGSVVGTIGTGKNILGGEKYGDFSKKMTQLFLSNTGVFLGFCQPKTPIDYAELFLNFLAENKQQEAKHAAYVLIFALQKAYPLSNCEMNKKNP